MKSNVVQVDLMTIKAVNFATTVHSGQVDKCGQPYILHVIRVAEAAAKTVMPVNFLKTLVVGLLHDVVEDHLKYENTIRKEFGDEVLQDVLLLTRKKDQSYEKYIREISLTADDSIVRRVKIADLRDNLNLLRYTNLILPLVPWQPYLDVTDLQRMNKYLAALYLLEVR